MPAEPRTCPICWNTFTAAGRNRHKHTYCSSRCRAEAGRRRARNTATGHTAANATHTPATKAHRPEPAVQRDCPHCGQPITIVALLTTPHVAAPQLVAGTPDVVPLHRVRTT